MIDNLGQDKCVNTIPTFGPLEDIPSIGSFASGNSWSQMTLGVTLRSICTEVAHKHTMGA